jgi:hypothetical protein
MAAPLLMRRRVMAAKVQSAAGTPATLAAADVVANVYDLEIQPEIESFRRERLGGFSHNPSVDGAEGGQVTFWTELHGDGANGAPAWADVFLASCGMPGSANVYKPSSDPPEGSGSATKLLTIGFYEDGLYKQLADAMGNVRFVLTNGQRGRVEFTYTGVWTAPTDVAMLATSSLPTEVPMRMLGSTTLIGGSTPPPVQEVVIDLGNEVILREDTEDAAGYHSALIVNQDTRVTFNPEARKVADWNPHGVRKAKTATSLSVALTNSTDTATFAATNMTYLNVQGGNREGVQIDDIEAGIDYTSGGDLSLTFS